MRQSQLLLSIHYSISFYILLSIDPAVPEKNDFITVKQAAELINREPDNINYLIQYRRINKYDRKGNLIKSRNGSISKIKISKSELLDYITKRDTSIEKERQEKLGEYNKELAFDGLPEKIRTKHVHRLHQYKGKFIPQLVEYFLEKNFDKDDLILDPFVGSGTTLVQANEMGIHSVGIDISPFNCMISEIKVKEYDIDLLEKELKDIILKTKKFSKANFSDYEKEIKLFISNFNNTVLPNISIDILPKEYAKQVEDSFNSLLKAKENLLKQENKVLQKTLSKYFSEMQTDSKYLKKWFSDRSLKELLYYKSQIKNYENQDIMKIILTRSTRSVRLVPHFDLASPKKPVKNAYYCYKHKQMCFPIQKAIGKLDFYTRDTVRRIKEFSNERTNAKNVVLKGDSRFIRLDNHLKKYGINKKFDGVFTSPPYVGNIDYHDQHIYAYELLKLKRYDQKEIGSLSNGKSKQAQQDYVKDISKVLRHLKKYMKNDAKIFFVANDRQSLYPDIAKQANMTIVKEYKRPVSNRTERDKQFYSETIFEMEYI